MFAIDKQLLLFSNTEDKNKKPYFWQLENVVYGQGILGFTNFLKSTFLSLGC